MATEEQLRNREIALSNIEAGRDQDAGIVVNSNNLSSVGGDPVVPPAPQPTDQTGVVDAQLKGMQSGLADIDAQVRGTETESDDLRTLMMETMDSLGTQAQRTQELEQQAGLGIQRKELQNVINELQTLQKEALAIPLSIQEEFAGRGATAGGVEPIQTGRLRQNAIKALSFSAIGQTLQGNIGLAEQNIQRAIDAEFEPQRQKLQILGQLYQFNREDLERIDKKRADQMGIYLTERERVLGIDQANKQEIYNIGLTASQFGADSAITKQIFESKTREEAVQLAGSYLQDPMAKQQLLNAKLDNKLKQAQINKVARETALLGQASSGELEIDMNNKATAIQAGEDQIALLEGLMNHRGMTKAVGAYKFARFTPFQADKSDVNEFVGAIESFTGQMTLDKLIESKSQGATFGALSDRELEVIAASASKINSPAWKKTREDGSVYFEVDEATFRAELQFLLDKVKDAVARKRGGILDAGEATELDELFGDLSNPLDYYSSSGSTSATNF